jgi:hypothetical protein
MSAVVPEGKHVTWELITGLAHLLEIAAIDDSVRPEDGARLVRMLLEFEKQLLAPVRVRRTAARPTG